MNVLFVASNIPTPTKANNGIILKIADRISSRCNVNILYPKPYVPFFYNIFKKHREVFKRNSWVRNGKRILTHTYIRLPFAGSAFRFFNYRSINSIFRDTIQPDLVHAHYIFADGSLALLIKKKYKIPYVITLRGYDARKITHLKKTSFDYNHAKEILQNAGKVFCLNNFQKEVIEEHFRVSVEVLPHGIDSSDIIDPIVSNESSSIKIAVVGELIEQKKISWVIDAVKEYSGAVEVTLDVYGDGDLRDYYDSYCRGIEGITMKGRVSRDEVLEALSTSDIFCLPSESETFGLVFLEAAARGNAMIGRYRDGIWEVFEHNQEMLYAKSESNFRELLYDLIENSTKRASLALNANEKVKNFTWEKIVDRYHDNYAEVIKNSL